MKAFFFRRIQWWRSEVEIRTGRRSNRRSKMAEKSRVTTPRGRHESLVPGVSSSRLHPDSDQSWIWCRARPWLVHVWLTEWAHLGRQLWKLCGSLPVTSDNPGFFFFLLFRECCLTRQWQSTDCDTRYMVQRKKFEVILRFLVDRYRRTKPPEPDASQFVVPARLPKPVIGSGGLSSSRFDDDVPEVNCTWTESFSWRAKEAALWFESYGSKILTGGTVNMIFTVHLNRLIDENAPLEQSTIETCLQEAYKYQKVTKISCNIGSRFEASCTGLRHELTHDDDERDDDRSHRRVSIMSSLESWRGLIPADHEYLDSVAWPCHDCDLAPVAPWRHKCLHVPVFPPSVWPSSRSNFDLGPSPSDSTEKTLSYQSLWFWSAVFLLVPFCSENQGN